ncbi:hypothetical protein SAMD00019534_028010 [Acytostelium subglobosum LB1]|uniref:hypothetical protein n=1 Tax=Acytostelium subglobosum LB1 TaxID=1410327 RepID=UPI000644A6A8|nr:hypothetical protein SAMD00019534_028010 [Acytostelium subglobosum LB1]GAM19626.1 hypothetical protein SAMD00019534_028010 [Acytostelium subglobosum LB1]|eukprot:XP_012756388.1 hypothetical protein SAMD00019534_028010 [Acytostelium subglobosum LB1]
MEKCAGTNKEGQIINNKKGKVVRKAKRRPPYLLRDYQRRQREFKWLETHIWHVKRMKMINLWKHKIAWKPNVKSYRPMFRASSHMTTIYDQSYNCCFEITGTQESICNMLKSMTPPDSMSIGATMYIAGTKEGRSLLHHPNRYPYHMITPIQFLWRPVASTTNNNNNQEEKKRQIWIWVHASAMEECKQLFNQQAQLHGCRVNSLDGELLRFELTGEKCHKVLNSILYPIDAATGTLDTQSVSAKLWNSLKQLRTPAILPPGTVIGMTVYDPRLLCSVPPSVAQAVGSIPKPNAPIASNESLLTQRQMNDIIVNWTKYAQASYSPLLDSDSRRKMSNLEPVAQVYQHRKNLNAKIKDYSIPSILLIQRDGGLTRGYGSGWDIILPKAWAMAFWLPLIYAGAWAIGLENKNIFLLEQGLPSFPGDFPDCKGYGEFIDQQTQEPIKKYQRTPEGKRPNYLHNCIYFPFAPNWQWVLRYKGDITFQDEDNQDQKEKKKAKIFSDAAKTSTTDNNNTTDITFKSMPYFVYRGKLAMSLMTTKKPFMKNSKYETDTVNQPHERGLVRVSVKMFNGGTPVKNSVIYRAHESDLEKLRNDFTSKNYGAVQLDVGHPTDPELFYQQTKRKPIGYVSSGAQSLVRGIGNGVGYCSAVQFVNLHQQASDMNIQPQGFAFIQNPTSRYLYPVILTIQP